MPDTETLLTPLAAAAAMTLKSLFALSFELELRDGHRKLQPREGREQSAIRAAARDDRIVHATQRS